MRIAYADPPYLGCCGFYDHYHPDGRCWDDVETHRLLIERLVTDFPDGWALSLTSSSLRCLLPLCPEDARIGAWGKTFGAFKKGVRPAYLWEPVIFRGGRNPGYGTPHPPPEKGGRQTTPKDFHVEHYTDMLLSPITLKRGLTGAKPAAFCVWVFDLLNLSPNDVLVDLFPGSGAVTRAWEAYVAIAAQEIQGELLSASLRRHDSKRPRASSEPGPDVLL